jgi:hypothetical protein
VRSSSGQFSSDPAGALRAKRLNTWSEQFFMENLLTDIKEQVSFRLTFNCLKYVI